MTRLQGWSRVSGARLSQAALAVCSLLALTATPALAEPRGLRPLGGEGESARTIGPGHLVVEGGAMLPMLDLNLLTANPTTDDLAVYRGWQMLPAWPEIRGLYGLPDGNEVAVTLGPTTSAGYRKQFLRAEAPWGNEYLQALIQVGAGFQLTAMKPMGYVRCPGIYERGIWTFHVSPGGYYLFNNQPIVDVQMGAEVRPFEALHLGGMAHLRMDAKHLTPMEGTWSFGGGARFQVNDDWMLQVEAMQENGPPNFDDSSAQPIIEFPGMVLRASVTAYLW